MMDRGTNGAAADGRPAVVTGAAGVPPWPVTLAVGVSDSGRAAESSSLPGTIVPLH
jgi:hypothetical protein